MRKSIEKSTKTIRLKTDYQELLSQQRDLPSQQREPLSQQRDLDILKLHQVSTMQTDDYRTKGVTLSKQELAKLYRQAQRLLEENGSLKKELEFYGKQKGATNGVAKALNS